jgi:serine/threonine protein kinase
VAITVLNMRLAPEDLGNFLNEARTFCLLSPNIIKILDFGIADGTLFLVMEYTPDGTLRQRHPRGTRVPLAIVAGYVNQITGALQYIHDEGLIHRDVKPDNTLINKNNEVVLGSLSFRVNAGKERSAQTLVPRQERPPLPLFSPGRRESPQKRRVVKMRSRFARGSSLAHFRPGRSASKMLLAQNWGHQLYAGVSQVMRVRTAVSHGACSGVRSLTRRIPSYAASSPSVG